MSFSSVCFFFFSFLITSLTGVTVLEITNLKTPVDPQYPPQLIFRRVQLIPIRIIYPSISSISAQNLSIVIQLLSIIIQLIFVKYSLYKPRSPEHRVQIDTRTCHHCNLLYGAFAYPITWLFPVALSRDLSKLVTTWLPGHILTLLCPVSAGPIRPATEKKIKTNLRIINFLRETREHVRPRSRDQRSRRLAQIQPPTVSLSGEICHVSFVAWLKNKYSVHRGPQLTC